MRHVSLSESSYCLWFFPSANH